MTNTNTALRTTYRTGYRTSRDVRTMARYHGITTSTLVDIARDLGLNVHLEETPGGRQRTRWTISENLATLRILADHLENHLEDMNA